VHSVAGCQPKIVDAGVLVTRNGDAAIKSTSNDGMTFTLDSLSADGQQSVFGVLENDVTSQDSYVPVFLAASTSTAVGGVNRRPYWFIAPTGYLGLTVDSYSGYNNTSRERHLYSHVMNDTASGTSTVYQDGTQVDTRSITLDANATFNGGQVLGVSTNATGALYMSEVIYYTSDQSDNRTAIEANIGETYGITGIPAYDNTVDGFVETWYDQSGNGNHATQSVIANQPKIVDAGVLVKRTINGVSSPSVKFTAGNVMTHGLTSLSTDGQQSLFFVSDNQLTSSTSTRLIEIMSNTADEARRRRPLIFRGNGGNLRFSVDTLSGLYITPSQTNFVSLYSSITEDSGGGTHIAYQDGSQFGSASVTLDANPNIDLNSRRFGNIASDELGAFFFTEVIYYPSDQSANRAAIETNINNQYDIY